MYSSLLLKVFFRFKDSIYLPWLCLAPLESHVSSGVDPFTSCRWIVMWCLLKFFRATYSPFLSTDLFTWLCCFFLLVICQKSHQLFIMLSIYVQYVNDLDWNKLASFKKCISFRPCSLKTWFLSDKEEFSSWHQLVGGFFWSFCKSREVTEN